MKSASFYLRCKSQQGAVDCNGSFSMVRSPGDEIASEVVPSLTIYRTKVVTGSKNLARWRRLPRRPVTFTEVLKVIYLTENRMGSLAEVGTRTLLRIALCPKLRLVSWNQSSFKKFRLRVRHSRGSAIRLRTDPSFGGSGNPEAFETPGFRVALPQTVIRGCPE